MESYITFKTAIKLSSILQCWQHLRPFLYPPNLPYYVCFTSRLQVFHNFIFIYLSLTLYSHQELFHEVIAAHFDFLSPLNFFSTHKTLLSEARTFYSISLYTLVSKCWVISKHYRKQVQREFRRASN